MFLSTYCLCAVWRGALVHLAMRGLGVMAVGDVEGEGVGEDAKRAKRAKEEEDTGVAGDACEAEEQYYCGVDETTRSNQDQKDQKDQKDGLEMHPGNVGVRSRGPVP